MQVTIAGILNILLQLEGSYKWYVLVAFLVIVTALVTRFIFKTIKWFLLLASFAVIVAAILRYFFQFDFFGELREEEAKPTIQVDTKL